MTDVTRLRTVKQCVKMYAWLTERALRHFIFEAEVNGLSRAIVRVGRKVLIDIDQFDAWVLGELGDERDVSLIAFKVLQWIRDNNDSGLVSLVDVYQKGPSREIRNAESAREVMNKLEDEGWVEKVDGGGEVNGEIRREVWRIK